MLEADSDYSINSDEEIKSLEYKNLIPKFYEKQDEILYTETGTSVSHKVRRCASSEYKFKQTLNKLRQQPTNITLVRAIDENNFNEVGSNEKPVRVHLALSRRSSRHGSAVPTLNSISVSPIQQPPFKRRKSRGVTYNYQELESSVQRKSRSKRQIYVTHVIQNQDFQQNYPIFRKVGQISLNYSKKQDAWSQRSTPKSILKSSSSIGSLRSVNTPSSRKKVSFEFTKEQIVKLKKVEINSYKEKKRQQRR